MAIVDFEFEFYSEISHLEPALREEARRRLRELTVGHHDIVGASVAMEELTGETTPHMYQARIVVYMRPDNLAAVEKSDSAVGALKGALNAMERQVREYRNQLREHWKQP